MKQFQRILISVPALVALVFGEAQAQPTNLVQIDIMPGDDISTVDPLSRGVIPVAILGSEEFEVSEVDADTLVFGPVEATSRGATPIHQGGGHTEDVNENGFTDLVSHYRTQDVGLAFGDTQACVSGEFVDGTAFRSCDDIRTTVGCGIGFELALLLPPLMWLRRRGRRIASQ